MYYELYVDSLFLVNFGMNLFVLLLVDRSLFRTATRKRLLLGAGAGALLYFLPFFGWGPMWLKLIVSGMASTIAMITITFRVRSFSAFWPVFERLLIISFLMGGAALVLQRCLRMAGVVDVDMQYILGIGMGLYLLFDYWRKKSSVVRNQCRATLICEGNRMTVSALLDSGNSLIEPISGKPVSIVERDIIRGLWNEEPKLYRAIPYHSIGKHKGILRGYLIPELRIETGGVVKICKNTYIAVCEEYISSEQNGGGGRIKMILNPLLLEEEKANVI